MAANTPMFGPLTGLAPVIQEDLKKLKGAWLWFLILGGALIVLGMVALVYSTLSTLVTVEVFGIFLMVGGPFASADHASPAAGAASS
jgi:uncharacterized membrane protein HdeD (DUF308 family)